MKITKLTLDNFQNYDFEEITFDSGVSLFYGVNGSGKSSILRAIFAGLFQSSACAEIPSGGRFKIEDFRRNGTNTGSVELEFIHNQTEYTVFWKFSDKTEKCLLYKEESLIAESTGEVSDAIQELINMDSEAFVNSTYVQQTELMKMITSKKAERKKVFDSLLGIDKIEEYIDRAHNSEMGVKDAVKQIRTQLKSLEDQISQLPSNEDIKTQLSQTTTDISKKQEQVEKLSKQIEQLEDQLEEYQESIERKNELTTERDTVQEELSEQKEIVETIQEKCNSLQTTLEDKKSELEEFITQSTYIEITYSSTDSIEVLTTPVSKLQEDAITATEESVYQKCNTYISDTIEGEQLEDPQSTLHKIQECSQSPKLVLPDSTDEFLVDPEELLDSFSETQSTVQSKRDRKEEQITQKKEQLEDKRKYLNNLLSRSDSQLALQASFWNHTVKKENLEYQESASQTPEELYKYINSQLENNTSYTDLQEEVNLLYTALLNEQSDTQEEINTVREDISELQTELSSLQDERDQLERDIEELNSIKTAIQNLAQHCQWKLQQKKQTLERKKEISQFCELYTNVKEISEQFSDKQENLSREENRLESLEEELENLSSELTDLESKLQINPESVTQKLEKLEEKKNEVQNIIPDLQAEKSQLEDKKNRRGELQKEISAYENRLSKIETTKQELSEIQSVYEQVRQTFREQFVEGINEYANDIFRNVYRNDRYQRIELDKEYGITIYTQNGKTIEPDLSSGGEAALINMTIRAAIYRVVSDMNLESDDPLPPIILDEPTTYLDKGHIEQLGSFIDTLESWNIEQIFIVSHNESLKQRCDRTYNVQINPNTGYSMVIRNDGTN